MKLKRNLMLFLCLILTYIQTSSAQEVDAALVTGMNGSGTVMSRNANLPLATLIKLRTGDTTEISNGSTLQLVYLATGLVESWKGPARFVVGKTKTEKKIQGEPSTRTLPSAMLEKIARAPDVMTDLRNRSGLYAVRSFDTRTTERMAQAQTLYDKEKTAADNTETTPDLYMFVMLYQAKRYRDASAALAKIIALYPDDKALIRLSDDLNAKIR